VIARIWSAHAGAPAAEAYAAYFRRSVLPALARIPGHRGAMVLRGAAGAPSVRVVTFWDSLEAIAAGRFSGGDREAFRPLIENLLNHDPFLVLADYADYVACQERVSAVWKDPAGWTRMSILNTARSGKFSSDRAIREYCERIWNLQPVRIAVR